MFPHLKTDAVELAALADLCTPFLPTTVFLSSAFRSVWASVYINEISSLSQSMA